MRRVLLPLLLLALAPLAHATEASVVLLDWREGHALAGAPVAAEGVNARAFPFEADQCHRHLLADLLYEEDGAKVDVPDVGEAEVPHVFRLELRGANATLASTRVSEPRHGYPLGVAPVAGAYEVRVTLVQGADVAWSLRVRGWEILDEPACGNLVEP